MSEVKITITDEAVKYITDLKADMEIENYHDSEVYLRLYVAGGGCSGMKYGLALEPEKLDTDTIIENNTVKTVVDNVSIKYIDGVVIGFSDTAMGGAFTITNPNASGCGCGKSFTAENTEESSSDSCSGSCCKG